MDCSQPFTVAITPCAPGVSSFLLVYSVNNHLCAFEFGAQNPGHVIPSSLGMFFSPPPYAAAVTIPLLLPDLPGIVQSSVVDFLKPPLDPRIDTHGFPLPTVVCG